MNAERDELVQIIWDGAVADRVKDGNDTRQVPVVRPKVEALADRILAKGYRKPRTVTTVEELDALPVESDDHDPCCEECLAWATGADVDEQTKRATLQDAINAAHERLTVAQQGVFLRKRDACPPRMEGDKPHCPDCSGIVGETGIVW